MAKKQNMEKTNAMRKLDAMKLSFGEYTYESDGSQTGLEISRMLGQDPDRVFKTLVTTGASGGHYVFVIPVAEELDLKKAAKAAGDKNMALIPVKDLLPLTGYIRGGCSPVGMKKKYPTFLDETAELWEEIAVSAGARGHQMILPPMDLAELIDAGIVDITL